MSDRLPRLGFWMMTLLFAWRDRRTPPKDVVGEAGLESGDRVLDYGCGPGSYTIAAAKIVGATGQVYAADINPVALEAVRRRAAKAGLGGIETILTECGLPLSDGVVDVVLLYDTLHDVSGPAELLSELHRVLKPGGVLSFSDHHLEDEQIRDTLASGALFELVEHRQHTYLFSRAEVSHGG